MERRTHLVFFSLLNIDVEINSSADYPWAELGEALVVDVGGGVGMSMQFSYSLFLKS